MRILYIHQFFATRSSKLGLIRSYEFARRWVEQGHQVTMVTSDSRLPEHFSDQLFAEGVIDGIDVRSVRVRYSNYMGFWRRLAAFATFMAGATWQAVSAGKHDVIFATSTPLTVGIPGWIAARLMRVPFVFEVRDLWPEAAIQMGALKRGGLLAKIATLLERFLYRRASRIIALSPGMAAGITSTGIEPGHVKMIPNSSDLDLFCPGDRDAELVEEHGLEGKFVVGYAGANGPSNALEDNIPSAARALRLIGRKDIVFAVVGDGKSLPELRRRCAGLPNVKFLGSMQKAEVPRFTRTADALLVLFADVPILATNSPNKLFDGLASGKPVIVNSAGWTKDLVESHGCGAYFPAGDGMALADIVCRLADDPEERRRMGVQARELAEYVFGRDLLASQALGVLREAIDEREAASRPSWVTRVSSRDPSPYR